MFTNRFVGEWTYILKAAAGRCRGVGVPGHGSAGQERTNANIMLRVEQLRMRSTKLLGELIPRKNHERILREACPRLQDAATGGDLWSILLDEADGDMNVNQTHQRILREICKAIAAELDAGLTEPNEDQAESCRLNPSVAHT